LPGTTQGDWAMDIAGLYGDPVYIDVDPIGIDGDSGAAGYYRVVAGDVHDWRPNDNCSNDHYQYFGIHVWDDQLGWVNYAWVVLGHINSTYSAGQTVISSTYLHTAAQVGSVASGSTCWPQHVHVEMYNYTNWSRSLDWDGPSNADDSTLGPACSRSGGNLSYCNPQVTSSDAIGYVGGTKTYYAQIDNLYYPDF
jgi:hypothetical protein